MINKQFEEITVSKPEKKQSIKIKNPEFQFDPKDPFVNDKLERRPIINNFTNIIQSTVEAFVISIESPWGYGKTTFVKMWKNHLEILGHHCAYFNAWENDFHDEPLYPLLRELSTTIEKSKLKNKPELEKRFVTLWKNGRNTLTTGLPIVYGFLADFFINVPFLHSFFRLFERLSKNYLKTLKERSESISVFKNSLKEFVSLLIQENEQKGVENKPLVIFIDEMDRCRPDFAVRLLERIKHLFSVDGIIFVLSMDRKQLEGAIKGVYGYSIKADGYLRRFIDLRYQLPEPKREKFIDLMFDTFHIMDRVSNVPNNTVNEFKNLMLYYCKECEFSLREIEQCFTEINLVLGTLSIDKLLGGDVLLTVAFLVVIKNHQSGLFLDFCERRDANVLALILQEWNKIPYHKWCTPQILNQTEVLYKKNKVELIRYCLGVKVSNRDIFSGERRIISVELNDLFLQPIYYEIFTSGQDSTIFHIVDRFVFTRDFIIE